MRIVVIAAALAVLVPATVEAAESCGPRSRMLVELSQDHGERPVADGLIANGAVLEVFVAPSGSWTLLITEPSGRSCIWAYGDYWEPRPAKAEGQGS